MEEADSSESTTNWCCIISILVVAGGLCFFGVSISLRGDGRTGLVLMLSSGGLLALSICAALGKCRHLGEGKATPSILEDPEDQPPSYKLSWRRSFKRRLRSRNADVEAGGRGGGGAGVAAAPPPPPPPPPPSPPPPQGTKSGKGWRGKFLRNGKGKPRTRGGSIPSPPPASFPNSDSSSSLGSLLAGQPEGGDGGGGEFGGAWEDGRQTQSLSNLLDPPSYQTALARLDDASIRKLRSEMCLPSVIH